MRLVRDGQYALVITGTPEITDRRYETASWYDVLRLEPGTYPIEAVTIDHKPLRYPGQRPYYGKVAIPATLLQHYTESRLLSEVRSHDERPMSPTLYRTTWYPWEIDEGKRFFGEWARVGGNLEFVEGAAAVELVDDGTDTVTETVDTLTVESIGKFVRCVDGHRHGFREVIDVVEFTPERWSAWISVSATWLRVTYADGTTEARPRYGIHEIWKSGSLPMLGKDILCAL